MAYNDILVFLDKVETGVDDAGDKIFAETRREVFCAVNSIGMKEFYQAAAAGLQPEIKFSIADAEDYRGEMTVEYYDVPYTVLRTYMDGTELEIVCYKDPNRTQGAAIS